MENNLISPQQYDFCAKHSTELAALNLVDYLTYKLDNGIIPINIYILIFQKLSTLEYIVYICLDKLSHYGVNDVAKTNRHQEVDFNGSRFDTLEIKTGVLQGSVLRPFLFSVYINDLPTCPDIFNMIMYADNTTLYCDINGNPADEHLLNMELCKITDWLTANKLSLNVNKTKCMIFHSDKNTILNPKLFIANNEIEGGDYFNFLGLELHHTLKWNKQLSCISLKISKSTGLLHKLKSEYPTSILKSIYNTLILSNINYCILSWGSQIDKLYLLQKRAIRNISKSDFRAHTEPLFKQHNILKVHDIHYMAILKFYSKLINDNLPNYYEALLHSCQRNTNTTISEIPVDYCQKSNTNFQSNL